MIVGGYRLWPAILLGAFVVNVTTAGSIATSLGIGVGNTTEALAGAWLVNRFAGGRHVFERARDVFKFALAAGLSTMISATIGVTSLEIGGYAAWAEGGAIWWTWWLGDAVGALIVTPVVVLWSQPPVIPRERRIEAVVVLLATVTIGALVFWERGMLPMPFVAMPPLIWAAFRLGVREAATLILILSGIAVTATVRGLGPFAVGTQNTSLLLVQVFMGTMAVTTLPLAAVVAERRAISQERLRLLERAQTAQTIAEEANRAKDEFLAMLSHELRTPLNSALGWAAILREGRIDTVTSKRGVETVERNIRLLARLIDDLIDLSRIAAGKLTVERKPVELDAVISAAAEAVRPAATSGGIALEIVVDAPGARVMGDGVRLQQVVWNVLSNAVKFTERGGRITTRLSRHGTHARILVTDTGRGIAPDLLPHVFERFRQAESAGARPHLGLGLGLAIVRHLVGLHGGTVTADSAGEGRGSTFTIELPLMTDGARSTPVEPSPHESPLPGLDNLNVLLVDDDPDSREVLAVILEKCGARPVTTGSTAQALEALDRTRFDVMVADIGMPGRDGYDLIRTVRARTDGVRDIPAVAFTAFAGVDDARRALEAGYDLHFGKPVEPATLTRALAVLAGRAGPR
ncbi:MAG: hypothetical protein AUH30_09805 [Candidatus Rokubacteria bacterium 13_1_40CM_68_15]|nr:MAG: hypothetical protein AUH30_09805 [Candidatus Rokubacteria bacterium 13_1_40CM_68_15]